MSVTVDANILVYASNEADECCSAAQHLVARLVEGPEVFYLFWPTALGYLRIVTHPAILPRPLSPRDASANVEALIRAPQVRCPGETEVFWETFVSVGGDTARGNAIPDSHLAALMRQNGVTKVFSRDRDLRRFDGIKVIDPF